MCVCVHVCAKARVGLGVEGAAKGELVHQTECWDLCVCGRGRGWGHCSATGELELVAVSAFFSNALLHE